MTALTRAAPIAVSARQGGWRKRATVLALVGAIIPVWVLTVPLPRRAPTVADGAKDNAGLRNVALASDGTAAAIDPALPAGLAPAMAAGLAPADYHLAPTLDGWRAANPAQGMTVAFSPEGPHISPAAGGPSLRLALDRVGRTGSLKPPAPALLEADGVRIDYRRGSLTEWYINDGRGVEQGFTLDSPPPGDRSQPVVVELAPAGGLRPVLDAAGSSVRFEGGPATLRYGGLHAYDAAGRPQPARLSLAGGKVVLTVDDAGAAYPLTIDPVVAIEEAHLFASDAAVGDRFGRSVAVSGDTAVVGAPFDDTAAGGNAGSAYVFVRSGATWTQQARLFASDAGAGDQFGTSVAISGNTVIVGAPHDYEFVNTVKDGSAYVFVRSGTTWSQQTRLAAATNDGYPDSFGISVAVSGDTAVVGRPGNFSPELGTVRVYVRSGGVWTQQASIHASGTSYPGDGYGYSVAISGETLVVGVPFDSAPLTRGAEDGSAFVYTRSGATWTEQAHLFASDYAAYDNFGASVAISVDTLVVGAPLDDVLAAGADEGSAYVFLRSGTTWSEQAHLLASGPAAIDEFGTSVAVAGNLVIVGVPGDHTPAFGNSGSAYVFERSGTAWPQQTQMFASDASSGDRFGTSVALSGDTAVMGATLDNTPAGDDTGSVYVSRLGPPPQADVGIVSMTDSPDPVVAGQNITYKVTVANSVTGSTAANVSLTDDVPANTTVVSRVAAAGWQCLGGATNLLSCTRAALTPADGNQVFTVVVKVNVGTSGSITNTATVRADGDIAATGNNVATTTTGVGAVRRPVADFNGDGKTDFGIYRASTGAWYVALVGGGSASASWGTSGDVWVPGDYNGDAKTDFGIYRPSTGAWYVALSGGGSTSATWGASGDVPVPGDYNGDDKTDFGVYRPSTGAWYVALAGGGSTSATWGATGDIPVPGDYNGDGKTDFGVYRPSNRAWYVAFAGGGSTSASWGIAGDVPVPGDYNGDGKTDFGVYRPSTGGWYVAFAGGGSTSASWGASGDMPVPGDYNGDGKTDFGVYRPSTGAWYVAFAGGGSTSASWGGNLDVPLPLPYAIWKPFYGT